jgi:hypothetical protein
MSTASCPQSSSATWTGGPDRSGAAGGSIPQDCGLVAVKQSWVFAK